MQNNIFKYYHQCVRLVNKNIPHHLFILFTLSIIFSIQYPLPGLGSRWVSLNASDIIILSIFIYFIFDLIKNNSQKIQLSAPLLAVCFLIVGCWVLITTIVALFRHSPVVHINSLWMLKWFEIFLLFLLAQYFSDRVNTKWIVPIIIGSGVLLSALAINTIIMSSGWTRASVFWQNPNALAIFLALPALFCLAYGFTYVTDTPVKGIGLILISLFLIIGIASTGSRVGMIVLFSGAIVISIILRNRIPILTLFYSLIIFTGTSFTILVLSGRYNFVRRFFPQITIEDGKLVSIQPPQGIEKRFELTKKGIDLWIEQPVFGYGWFSSPEHPTVGFLDFFYIQILVDLGIVGFILVLVFYFQFIREFLSRRHLSPKVIPAVGAGWLIGILAGGIGEAWPRVPRIMFLLILILITTLELEESTKD